MSWHANHFRDKEENNVDPDDGKSWLCGVCNLPIFSSPFIKSYADDDGGGGDGDGSRKVIYMHDQCANLPKELNASVVHPGHPLILLEKPPGKISRLCDNCRWVRCGTKFYQCPDKACFYTFDVVCALTTSIRILHRSHEHRLTAVRGATLTSSLICSACGTRHHKDDRAPLSNLTSSVRTVRSWSRLRSRSTVSYLCHACGFWIHPHCASLPNTVVLQHPEHHHQHPLVLKYYRGPDSLVQRQEEERDEGPYYCAICQGIIQGVGMYSCIKCRNYNVDIMCADPQKFKPVFTREARLPDLVRLPVPDENTSMVRYIIDSTSSNTDGTSSSSSDHHDDDDDDELLQLQYLHEHPLILHYHDDNDNDDDEGHPVCNACVQFISPPDPFYRCSECPNFFLHNFCARLPPTLPQHPAHEKDHTLSLITKHGGVSYKSMLVVRSIRHHFPTNGFIYSCQNCQHFDLDVVCALMPASITHEAHAKTHILYSSFRKDYIRLKRCDCCGDFVDGPYYECGTCRNFRLHYSCALLPNTVRHKFDPHPLKLTTFTTASYKWSGSSSSSTNTDHDSTPVHGSFQEQKVLLCEVCEEGIYYRFWYYNCDECNQSFHTNCIPCLDCLSKMKFGATNIRVECHGCPLSLIRASTVSGYRCGHCGDTIRNYHIIAYECSKCDFRIHGDCADNYINPHSS